MRILIISANVARTPYPVYPLGASVVATALREAGHEVEILDFLQHECSMTNVAAALREREPELVGISMRNLDNVNMLSEERYLASVRRLVREVRTHTCAPVVIGGSGFSVMPERILDEVGADWGISGEGERAVVELVAAIERGCPPPRGCIDTPPLLRGAQIRRADYDADILRFYLRYGRTAPVQTKRGCTHHCIYCSYPVLEGTEVRARPVNDVVDDVERLTGEFGADRVFFTDSVFNDGHGHYLRVVEEMLRRGVETNWTAFFRPTPALDDETVARLRVSGLCDAEIGTDACTDTTLRRLGKSFTFDEVVRCNDVFVRHGVSPAHYVMFGCPGETRNTVEEGLRNIARLGGAAVFVFLGIRVLPGTPLARIAREDGSIAPDDDLLDPVYYLSPDLDRDWIEERLTQAFADRDNVVYPPDALDGPLHALHRRGVAGNALEFLVRNDGMSREAGA